MKVDGKTMHPIWLDSDRDTVQIIDQRRLPHALTIVALESVEDVIGAIQKMLVRGAPLIGVTAAYGMFIAARNHAGDPESLRQAAERIRSARPTAVNLAWAVDRMLAAAVEASDGSRCVEILRREAARIANEEIENCRRIGEHGRPLLEALSRGKNGAPVNVLTHCNAGWLACVEFGTATAPIYAAHDAGIPVHVWVDETRPLNQGARLTAWELGQHGVAHTVITDNAGGHLMQQGRIDIVIVGTDRTTVTGDVANKIGTYLKALAAKDNQVPFYVALPSSTIDWNLRDGLRQIPIEERDPDEIRFVEGRSGNQSGRVQIVPDFSPAANFAFDVTPARLVTGLITERGICKAEEADIRKLFPEKS
jgi:methylthioribose-1-phosphate isomerase